jgi:phytoene dehydrogenase-like protein
MRIPAGKYLQPRLDAFKAPARKQYDALVIGGGHNGLVHAAYLARGGLNVLVLERRHVVGGACVTEELVPGFKFSRGSYLAGLLRPQIIEDLDLKRHGFKYLQRTPSSFTPTLEKGRYLMLGHDNLDDDLASIAQFSTKDAAAYVEYEKFLSRVREVLQPLIDTHPPEATGHSGFYELRHTARQLVSLFKALWRHRLHLADMYELLLGPAKTILDRFFESEILKATLATDAVIGAVTSPSQQGSAYVLVHHVMGQCDGRQGVWAYVEGGMGAISDAVAKAALDAGAEIVCNAQVESIIYSPAPAKGQGQGQGQGQRQSGERRAVGVVVNGLPILADTVVSGATPYSTFWELGASSLEPDGSVRPLSEQEQEQQQQQQPGLQVFRERLRRVDYGCGAMKINLAVSKLPTFTCIESPPGGAPGRMHRGTVHFESHTDELEAAFRDAVQGRPAATPVIEMTIPSALDATIAPEGSHVVQLFVNYVPYGLKLGEGSGEGAAAVGWDDEEFVASLVKRVLDRVDVFCPGFSQSIVGMDVLTPRDLERIFGLHQGNFHHGALGLHQLLWARPSPGHSSHRTPVPGLYLCGSGAHPGGGVQGAPGRNAARVVLSDRGLPLK